MVHVSVGSPAGTYSVASASFFRYVVRLADTGLPLRAADRDAVDVLAAIPNAFVDEDEMSGRGWRVVPAASDEDWPVLEVTPQRLRGALQTARRILWENAAPVGISALEIVSVDEEIDKVLAVLARAEAAGFSVNVSYVS
ncbi:MAG: hypothetical protein JO060_07980 [Candidatus Eremiobacteraeota bacterium]|nr:hypothetical protein [Candidatus Eremiobacteraeota bacterium]MBV9646227.1 hypothetical protein [Candidatus Eremiobacteraeota bacterium]